MKKNILIIGAARSGKTTLAKKLSKEKGYNLISIDNIVSGFEAYPELEIKHDGNDSLTSSNLAPFLIKLFTELSEGSAFYDDVKFVIEGTHIDFEKIMPFLQNDKYREKYAVYYYNSWQNDNHESPLLSLLYNLIKFFLSHKRGIARISKRRRRAGWAPRPRPG